MTEQVLWLASISGVVCFAGALSFVVRKLRLGGETATDGANERIARDYYKPMGRLLSEEEFERLASMGFTPKQVQLLRASRRRAFVHYLTDLQADFRALHQEARVLLRDSQADRPDLAMELVRQYAGFQYSVLLAHFQLTAHALGVKPLNVKGLLEPVQWMHQQVELLRMPMPSAI